VAISAEAAIQPQAVLPVQFHPARAATPASRLALAILEDALRIYGKRDCVLRRKQRRLLAETEAWLCSDDVSWPFSFVNVCHVLDIDPAWLRERLLRSAPPAWPAGEDLPLASTGF
jgi:hypothetical protein